MLLRRRELRGTSVEGESARIRLILVQELASLFNRTIGIRANFVTVDMDSRMRIVTLDREPTGHEGRTDQDC